MISIFAAFGIGLKDVYKNKKLIVLFFLVQFVFAYVLTKPFSDLLTKAFSKTTLSDIVLERFNLIYFYTMFKELGQGVSLFGLFIPSLVLYFLIIIFLTAGVYWLFFSRSEFKLLDFSLGCGKYFTRFLKLYSLSFLFYLGCLVLSVFIYGILIGFTDDSISEVWPTIFTISSIGIFVFLIFLVMMLFDYAKVILITENNSGLFSAIIEALKFFMMNFFKTLGIYLLYIFTAILLFIVFKFFISLIVTDTFFKISLYFILSQVFVFMRQYLRLALFDSVIVYYQSTMTAMPGMLNKEMLEMAVENYEKRMEQEEEK